MQPDQGWLDFMARAGSRRLRLESGEILFHQGSKATAVYRVETGRIRLVRHLEDGTSVALHVARTGETFAEASMFATTYHCDAVADVATEVIAVPKAKIATILATDAQSALALVQHLALQVRDLRARLEMRNVRSASARVLAWLRHRASGTPPTIELDQTWTEIATEIGLTREATYRALAALQRDRVISRTKSAIVLGQP